MLAHQLHRAHEHSFINFFIFLLVHLSCSVIVLFCHHGSNCPFFLYIYVPIKRKTVFFFTTFMNSITSMKWSFLTHGFTECKLPFVYERAMKGGMKESSLGQASFCFS